MNSETGCRLLADMVSLTQNVFWHNTESPQAHLQHNSSSLNGAQQPHVQNHDLRLSNLFFCPNNTFTAMKLIRSLFWRSLSCTWLKMFIVWNLSHMHKLVFEGFFFFFALAKESIFLNWSYYKQPPDSTQLSERGAQAPAETENDREMNPGAGGA